jgi:hypothetical protein
MVKPGLSPQQPILAAASMLMTYGLVYVGLTMWWKVPEAQAVIERVARVVRKAAR